MAPKVRVSNVWHLPLLLIKKNATGEPLNETSVVRIKAPLEATEQTAIYVVVVIDTTYSTAWDLALPSNKPSRLDLLKKAMKFIIRQLHDGDCLAIVFNDNLVIDNIKISDDARVDAENRVHDLLRNKDDTAFRPTLQEAIKILDARVDKTSLGFIILLSDGLDNSKFKWNNKSPAPNDPVRDDVKKYPVHTFGLCKAHDPKALCFIAKESKGTYSSITENLNSKIIEALAICLGGLLNVVAVDTVITVTANQSVTWQPKIKKINSGGYNSSISRDETSCNITIGTLYAGEVKDLIVDFELNVPSLDSGGYKYALLTASGDYKGIPGGQPIDIRSREMEFSVYARRCTPNNEMPLVQFPMILQHKVQTKVLKMLGTFQKEFHALEAKAEGDDVKNLAGNELREMWKDFKKSKRSWKDAQESGLNLEGIENDISAMVKSLKQGLGVGCVYSWVLSYQMQRATTTGLPAAAFLTPKMKQMVQRAQEESAEAASSSAESNTQPWERVKDLQVLLYKLLQDVSEMGRGERDSFLHSLASVMSP
ncbi:hypothetical protein C2845_PM04G17190 [Panicum miliaceum]|uniref:VWFA domain-containing protein n=1 Tax=Panicum miliaceum TaxID=4540 RepID=A0A3L6QVA0_PANMI|nr:hypothetical protein C2845_PM04G17190 [Panicum miliaceum]